MARINGTDGAVTVGATSNASLLYVNNWSLTLNVDVFVRKPLGVANTQRDTGHTDWTGSFEADLDHSDAQLTTTLTPGAAITFWLYTDESNTEGWTGASVIESVNPTVGADTTKVTVNFGGNAALSAIS